MRLVQLRLPFWVAVRPTVSAAATTPAQPAVGPVNAAVDGRRQASTKAQGAYKLKNKKTLPKKMGAKRVGDQYVLPGTILYKQRGTLWHAGENAILGRDHTIHAAVAGYVKYYRDPHRHPDRQYIGVTFERNDALPYSPQAPRKRRLGMVAVPLRAPPETEPLTRSGIPRQVVRLPGLVEVGEDGAAVDDAAAAAAAAAEEPTNAEAAAAASKAAVQAAEAAAAAARPGAKKETKARRAARRWNEYMRVKRTHRVLFVNKSYAYRESNFMIGRLMGSNNGTRRYGSRHAVLRHRRKTRDAKIQERRVLMRQQRALSSDKANKNTGGKKKKGAAPAAAKAKGKKKAA